MVRMCFDHGFLRISQFDLIISALLWRMNYYIYDNDIACVQSNFLSGSIVICCALEPLRERCHKPVHRASTALKPSAATYAAATITVQINAAPISIIAIGAAVVTPGVHVTASTGIATIDNDGRTRGRYVGKRGRRSRRTYRRFLPARCLRRLVAAGSGRLTLRLRDICRRQGQKRHTAIGRQA